MDFRDWLESNEPTKGININDKSQNFTDLILAGIKTIETRDSRSLDSVVGKRVGIIRTGKGPATLVGYVTVGEPKFYRNQNDFDRDRKRHHVGPESPFYIGDNGKWGYPLTDPERTRPRPITNRGIVIRNIAESSEPDLAYLLGPAGSIPQIGPERQIGNPKDGSVKFLSPHGSYRYVHYVDGKPASALQIVSRDGINGQVANVYTLPEYRKQGLARGLLDRARRGFEKITHSRDLSTLGAIWKGKVDESNDPLRHSGDDPEDIFWAGIDPHVEPPKPGEKWFRGHPHNTSRIGLALWLTRSQPDAQFYGDTTAYEISPNARFGTYKDLVRAVRESGAKRYEIKPASGFDGHNDNDFIYVPKVQNKLKEMGIDALLISDVMTNYEIDALVVLNKRIVRAVE